MRRIPAQRLSHVAHRLLEHISHGAQSTMSLVKFPFTQLPHIESSPKRVRVFFGGEYIVDTTDALLV